MMRVVYRTIVLAVVAMALIVVAFFFKLPPAKAAARSVKVIIKNDTDRNLTNVSVSVQHGIVTRNPPNSIPPSEAGELFAESRGFLTGTEGTVTYQLDGINGTASFHWDNPYAGSNSANGSAPAGFQVEQIGNTGNRTLVFFSIHFVNRPVASCNPDWVIGHLGTHAEDQLDGVDKADGFLTTPFKRMGIGGWVDTGCEATAEGWPVRDAQHSTDGFWTIDVRLSQFAINGRNISNDQQRFVRIEVEPNTPAHQSAAAKANLFIRFKGRVLIDTHHGDELIEVHPWDPITLAPEPSAPKPPKMGSVNRPPGPPLPICDRARRARAQNSPAAPFLEAQCRQRREAELLKGAGTARETPPVNSRGAGPTITADSNPVMVPNGQASGTTTITWKPGPDYTYCEIYLSVDNGEWSEFARGGDGTKAARIKLGSSYTFRMMVYEGQAGTPKIITTLTVTAKH